ncbi:MAG: energy transducer TonB [Acidobacteria bacterium]|nr:energy transducer TonB [Acidobacteriota bacterium]
MRKGVLLIALVISGSLSVSVFAQKPNKEELAKLLTSVADDERAVVACERQIREQQIKEFGKPLPRISGHCFSGCPISVTKPHYPEIAKRNRISGDVVVRAIVDEEGNVVFAKVIKGRGIFRASALAAAYHSRYQPKVTCGDRKIKFWWQIRYHFSYDM